MPTDSSGSKTALKEIPLLPLRDILVFPSTVVPLFVGREKSIQALEQAMATNKEILLAAQRKAKINEPTKDDIFEVGTVSTILQLLRLPDGTVKVLVEGQRRAKVEDYIETEDFFLVEAREFEEEASNAVENEALIRTVKMSFDNYVRLNKRIPPEMLLSISAMNDESKLSDTLIAHLNNLKLEDKQKLLEEANPAKRLEDIYGYIQSEIEIMRVEKKIRARVKRQMEKTQKEYYLNEQIQAIQKELGDREDSRSEFMEIDRQLKEKKLSKEARERLTKEVKKLKQMSPMSAEATVVRNYLDTVLSLPWGENSKEIKDTVYAEKILNKDHFGLDKVKDRILEYLSVRTISDDVKGPILCLFGPPGVGKTSLAKSVAAATGREFVRVALGGVRDEAEIRGHRKTYIGSMPGKIIQALKKAGTNNPVVLLDEIDKLSQDFRGDPASALLEVLDPEQNATFVDHYLDLEYDLSKVLFLCTSNSLHTIPRPLLDRMEVISLAGYTEEEKVAIANQYLVSKLLKRNGLEGQKIDMTNKAISEVIRYYTRESGVRNLEREIATIFRKVARKHTKKIEQDLHNKEENKDKEYITIDLKDGDISEKITDKSVNKYLGPRKHRIGLQNEINEVGLCTGMAWTEVGGDLLVTEVAVFKGKGKLTITGKLGEVMQESAQAALSYVRSRADFLNLDSDFNEKNDIHIHVPEGSIPKDGPSAGITMATAITSALSGRPVSKDVAMTGEITLRGRVLPIGGLKEKILAAHRGGITKILIPKENEKDILDIPKNILKGLKVIPVDHMDQVLMHALVWKDPKTTSDEVFQRLQETTETELSLLSFTH